MKETIELSEEKILKLRLISVQTQLVNASLENLELKKQILVSDKKVMENNFQEIKKEISDENEINFDDYFIDFSHNKLVRKK